MSKKAKAAERKRQAGEIRGFNDLSYALHSTLSGIMSSFRLSLTFRIAMHYCWQLLSTTLLTALIVMRMLDASAKSRNIFLFIGALALIVLPYFLHFSYKTYGVLVPLCFFLFRKYRGMDALTFSALTYGKYLYDGNFTQVYAIAASVPILLYNGKRGAFSLKYFFYIIYPAHLLLLYAAHYILSNHLLPF